MHGTAQARIDSCGRRFDSVCFSQSKPPDIVDKVQELLEENRLLRERTRSLTTVITDLSKVIESLENKGQQPAH